MNILRTFPKKLIALFILGALLIGVAGALFIPDAGTANRKAKFWKFQAIDTMKFSRDVAREKLSDSTFDVTIEQQIKQIADSGATHVAIATPYDQEFLPFLKRWVRYARQYKLKVWFRGNFSGWEKWFGYEKIDRVRHVELTERFILANSDLFENGDVFSACPECENGGPGDPRRNGDAQGHKEFLIHEYEVTKKAFKEIDKEVNSGFNSMNGDVARLIMDPETTAKLGGIVVVDHYVKTPEQLNEDIHQFARLSKGKVILGEFGAPIPDIHGELSQVEQAEWLSKTMSLLVKNQSLVGLSYWTNSGGSTQLWESSGEKRAAVDSLTQAYNPYTLHVKITDVFGRNIRNSVVKYNNASTELGDKSETWLPSLQSTTDVEIEASGYSATTFFITKNSSSVVLQPLNAGILEKAALFIRKLMTSLLP